MSDRSRPDHWTRKAKDEGFPARSVYKLEEIDRAHRVVPRGGRVLDLGCTPGSWSRYVARTARVVGVDINPSDAYPGTFVLGSVLDLDPEVVRAALGGPADAVISDMAPPTTGDRFGDHVRQVELARVALGWAVALLKPGGAFVVKVFEGEDAPGFVTDVRARFTTVKRMKPAAVRSESVEFYVIGLGFKPQDQAPRA